MSEEAFAWSYFATIPSWLLRSREVSDGAKLFFCALTATCRESGECCKTNAQLAEELRCGERSVSRWVKELEGTGIISFKVSGAAQTGGNRERKIWLEWTPHRLAKIGETANIGETDPDRLAKFGETDLLNKNKKYTPIAPKGGEREKGLDKDARDDAERALLFDRFYALYPRKVGKQAARRAWEKLKPDLLLCSQMSQALKRQIASEEWQRDGGRYIPHPSTWLNGRRWEDEQTAPTAQQQPTRPKKWVGVRIVDGQEVDIFE